MSEVNQDLKELKAALSELEAIASLERSIADDNAAIRKANEPFEWELTHSTYSAYSSAINYESNHPKRKKLFIAIEVLIGYFIASGLEQLLAPLLDSENEILSLVAAIGILAVIPGLVVLGYYLTYIWEIWIPITVKKKIADYEIKVKEEKERAQNRYENEKRRILREKEASIQKHQRSIAQHRIRLNSMTVLAKQDMNLHTVKFVINQIETRRANSVTEALRQYDEHRRRESKLWGDVFNAEMQRQQDADRRLREAEEHMRQTFHNLEMQKQARRAVSELEEINQKLKDLED